MVYIIERNKYIQKVYIGMLSLLLLLLLKHYSHCNVVVIFLLCCFCAPYVHICCVLCSSIAKNYTALQDRLIWEMMKKVLLLSLIHI